MTPTRRARLASRPVSRTDPPGLHARAPTALCAPVARHGRVHSRHVDNRIVNADEIGDATHVTRARLQKALIGYSQRLDARAREKGLPLRRSRTIAINREQIRSPS